MKPKNVPTVFVILGATGDLMSKKIVPALFHLYLHGKLPKLLKIIGFSRRDWENEQFLSHVKEILSSTHHSKDEKDKIPDFLRLFEYFKGGFEELKDYENLSTKLGRIDGEWKVCANKLFYLAVPPQYYKTIFLNLHSSGLTIPCSPDEGWTRVLVEKPFGKDQKTAEELDTLLGSLFKEEQIYRIDHYLAKDMIQNILNFRFSNNLFEQSWNNKLIEKIDIRLLEKDGVETRGSFYDGVGALRDVGQNHILQILALITMDRPTSFSGNDVRVKRADILNTLMSFSKEDVKNLTYRAQYKGYKKIKGVNPESKTETYFKVKAYMTSPKFSGIPIILEGGKRIKNQIKEIIITFKHPTPCLCPPGQHLENKIVISLDPFEAINIHFWARKPGFNSELEERTFNFLFREKDPNNIEEYERLLLDCISGNQLLFLSTREVSAMWKFIDPIVKGWGKDFTPLNSYKSDTNQAVEEADLEETVSESKKIKEIGVVGLGKMGGGIARHLLEKGYRVVGYNRTKEVTEEFVKESLVGSSSISDLVGKLKKPRIIWIMLTAGKAVDDVLFGKEGLVEYLEKGDIVVEAGNSFYKDSIRRAKMLEKKGIKFVDAGVSGGPGGARYGACMMVGGKKEDFDYLYPLFADLSINEGVEFFEGYGAGHFTKMIHNGIEYGMMQALAEGFAIMKNSKYKLDLSKVSTIYNHGSVIESRLVGWLENAFKIYGNDLKEISGIVGHTGEGEWTVKTAEELKVKAKVIEDALKFRIESEKNPTYTGKILSALRNQFGGHKAK